MQRIRRARGTSTLDGLRFKIRSELHEKARAYGETLDSEKPLRRQLVKTQEFRGHALEEPEQLKADHEALVGPLQQVVLENRRRQLHRNRVAEQPPRPAKAAEATSKVRAPGDK
ncbi:hypothetical protein [Streptomyces pseudovenezuelae]|uniref:Uncharacterized protein n=1 Tax=Streptomyces pseudovenezuelae TaxID=67350 RepID=A0ABZ1X4Q8_9ACTN|nr:hypothetical protein [Streptomyces pseudovenezuelae]